MTEEHMTGDQSIKDFPEDGDYAPTHILKWERKFILECYGLPYIPIPGTSFVHVLMQLHESPYFGYPNIWLPVK